MLHRILLIVTVLSIISLSLMMVFTTPSSIEPIGLLVIFVSAYLGLVGLVSFFLWGSAKIIAFLTTNMQRPKPFQPLSLQRSYYYSTVVAAAPVLLIGLQSVGGVGIYELILVIIFVAVGCLYVTKRAG